MRPQGTDTANSFATTSNTTTGGYGGIMDGKTYFLNQMTKTIIRRHRSKVTSNGMRTLITLKPVKKKSRKR